MAIIKCPQCNKQISDRVKSCPHCGFVIIEETIDQKQDKEEVIYTNKQNFKFAGLAAIITILAIVLWQLISYFSVSVFIGSIAATALKTATIALLPQILLSVIFCAIVFSLFPNFFQKYIRTTNTVGQLITSFILSVLLIAVFSSSNVTSIAKINVDAVYIPIIFGYAQTCHCFFGLVVPLLLGGMYISNQVGVGRNQLVSASLVAATFLILVIICNIITLILRLGLGVSGINISGIIATVMTFIATLVITNLKKK